MSYLHTKGTADHFSGRVNDLFTKLTGGNKSGGLLLTNFILTTRHSDERLTIRLAIGAVQDGDGKRYRDRRHDAPRRSSGSLRKIVSQPVPILRTPR